MRHSTQVSKVKQAAVTQRHVLRRDLSRCIGPQVTQEYGKAENEPPSD